jgi:hypothetical protein
MTLPFEIASAGQPLLITDNLAAPADFLLHRFLANHLKKSSEAKSVVITVLENVGGWKAVAAKFVCGVESFVWFRVGPSQSCLRRRESPLRNWLNPSCSLSSLQSLALPALTSRYSEIFMIRLVRPLRDGQVMGEFL